MKNLDLSNYSVQEMNAEEMIYVDGGKSAWWPEILAAYVITEWSNIKKGVRDAVNEFNY